MLYETIFNIFNSGILLFWLILLVFPKKGFTQRIVAFPWVPLAKGTQGKATILWVKPFFGNTKRINQKSKIPELKMLKIVS